MSKAQTQQVSQETRTRMKATQEQSTEKKEKAPRIGEVAIGLLKQGLSPQDVLAKVKEQFPNSATKMNSIYWYASKNGIDLQARRNDSRKEEQQAATETAAKTAAQPAKGRVKVKEPARISGSKRKAA